MDVEMEKDSTKGPGEAFGYIMDRGVQPRDRSRPLPFPDQNFPSFPENNGEITTLATISLACVWVHSERRGRIATTPPLRRS